MATDLRLPDALLCLLDSVINVGHLGHLAGQFLQSHLIRRGLISRIQFTHGLFGSYVCPGELLLQFIGLVALLAGFLGLFKTSLGLLISFLEVRDDLGLPCQDLGGLTDILHTRLILFAELAELRPFQEELNTSVSDNDS